MNETLFTVAGVSITITAVYAVISLIILILFMSLWLRGRKKRTGSPIFAGQVMNGIGFGFLPAIAILKAFQEMSTGAGIKVNKPMPVIYWLTEEGFYRPGRIEATAALCCFAFICLWLIIRKKEIPDNGDLFMIGLCLWSAIRLVTEDFRSVSLIFFHITSCATILGCLILWLIRRAKIMNAPGRTIMDILAVCICIAMNLAIAGKILSSGSEIGDFAAKTGSAFLMLILTLIVGGDVRKLTEKNEG